MRVLQVVREVAAAQSATLSVAKVNVRGYTVRTMLSQTRQGLEAFDNQHDFERLAADVLNGRGYSDVEPMAPAGGSDGGRDIEFRDGDDPGLAFVTLEKDPLGKFRRDLAKHSDLSGVLAFFCNTGVSPANKVKMTEEALAKGARLVVFDVERLRSLLDSSLKDVRRRYLHIDDEPAARLRADVTRLLRFPDAAGSVRTPTTMLESIVPDKTPIRLFELLLQHDEQTIRETPTIGTALHRHLSDYYGFRQRLGQFENALVANIGRRVLVQFRAGWLIYHKYAIMRFAGLSREQVVSRGDFLNYDITWDDAERVFQELCSDAVTFTTMTALLATYANFVQSLTVLRQSVSPEKV